MKKNIGIKWLKQALHDLEMAEKNIDIGGYDIAAFLSHQSVEKLLKALLAFRGKTIPKIHYIDDLGQKLNLSDKILDEVIDLTSDYIFSRYPDVSQHVPYEEYTKEIATNRVAKAKTIFNKLKPEWKGELNNE